MTKQRDILLVPFPFSDQSGKKIRPVLVLSSDSYNKFSDDMVVCGITSNVKQNIYSVTINDKYLEIGKLYEQSSVKADNLLKINKNLVIKNIGTLNHAKFLEVLNVLNKIFDHNPH